MQKIPSACYSITTNVITTIVTALFFLLFSVLYNPDFGFDNATLEAWTPHNDFCIAIISAIILVTLALSRFLLLTLTHRHRLSKREYLVWLMGELVVTCLFADLFLALFFHLSYLMLLPRVLAIGAAIAIYPYVVCWLFIAYQDRTAKLTEAEETIARLRQGIDSLTSARLNFPDENGNIKLAVSADQVIAIESAGNYVTILYEDEDRITRFALRNTLKQIETLCEDTALVRCHRSYLVNIKKIKLLRRDPSGMFAEINASGIDDIPVSKTYANEITQRFSEK